MDTTKFIINQLNKPPFNKNYNVIMFDSLQHEELIQVLSDVLVEINNEPKAEVQLEDPEHTIVRLFNMLRILKYKPPNDIDPSSFKQGLIQGEKHVIHPILKWVLSNINELKNRAYLAKFLVKVNIPTDVMGDTDIANLYRQYEILIEEFTKAHKENSKVLDSNKITTTELISDCSAIEREKEIVSSRIDQLKHKIESIPNHENILNTCGKLRIEKDKKRDLTQHLQDEIGLIQRGHQQLSRMIQQLQELKNNSVGLSPNTLLNNLGEETSIIYYIANQKLPQQLAQQRQALDILQNIADVPNLTDATNSGLQDKINSLTEQVTKLKQAKSSSQLTDKDLLFDQHTGVISGVKDSIADKFFELKNITQMLDEELKGKKQKLQETKEHAEIATSEKFQEYVRQLRAQSLIYKQQRGELSFIKTEVNILSRTINKLLSKRQELGIEEFEVNVYEMESQIKDEENLLHHITDITTSISSVKSKILPYIVELKPLQEEIRKLQLEYDEGKNIYDKTLAALDTNVVKLQQDVVALREQHTKTVSKTHLYKASIAIFKVNLERANNELQMYTDKNNSTPTLRERYHRKIAESEKYGRILKEEQTSLCASEGKLMEQKELWNNLNLLLEYKRKNLENEWANDGVFHLVRGAETLVLDN